MHVKMYTMCMSEEQMHPNILSAIIIVASAIHGHFSACVQNMHWPGGSLKKKQQSVKSLQELQRAVVWNGLHQSCSHSAALLVLPISGG